MLMIAMRVRVQHGRPEDLHVAREHDEVGVVAAQHAEQLGLRARRASSGVDRQVVVRHAVEGGERRVVGVVADDGDDLGRQLAGAPAGEQVGQAVRLRRGEDRDPRPVVGEAHLRVHAEALRRPARTRRRCVATSRSAPRQLELDPLEEDAGLAVGVLLGVHDVAAAVEDELRDRVDEAGLVGTGEQQDRVVALSACPSGRAGRSG